MKSFANHLYIYIYKQSVKPQQVPLAIQKLHEGQEKHPFLNSGHTVPERKKKNRIRFSV